MRILMDVRAVDGPPSGVRDIAAGLLDGFSELSRSGEIELVLAGAAGTGVAGAVEMTAPRFMTVGLPTLAIRRRADRILIPRQTVPPISPVPAVPFFHDIGFIDRPDLYPGQDRILKTTKLAARSRRSLAVSEFTADAMHARGLGMPHALPIQAIHRIEWNPIGTDESYILCVAAQEPHKNLVALVEAWGRASTDGFKLVLCGRSGKSTGEIDAAIRALRRPDSVHVLRDLSDTAYAELLVGASGYVQPSLYEGLCIPALDLAAAGAPVLAADAANLGTVFRGTPNLFRPDDTAELASKLSMMCADQGFREELVEQATARVTLTDWNDVASRALEAMR